MVKSKNKGKLNRQDWIEAALKVLANKGIDAVKVEPLARSIEVTKGSFYWHFRNRDNLLEAILQEWERRETNRLIEQVESIGGDAATKLWHLFELATEIDGRLENAVRAWAAQDIRVSQIIDRVDRNRLDYTRDLFLQVGFTPQQAKIRAQMAYYSLVGEFVLGIRKNQAERLQEVRWEYAILSKQD